MSVVTHKPPGASIRARSTGRLVGSTRRSSSSSRFVDGEVRRRPDGASRLPDRCGRKSTSLPTEAPQPIRFATLPAVETKWFEDFVSLAETRSFSRSAKLRHVTQPAFSRRIQSLEAWAGIDLVDRSSYPTRLTSAGETLHAQALEVLGALQTTRNMMRSHKAATLDMIEFAVPHSLAFTFFPHWVMDLRKRFVGMKSRLSARNVHDAVLQLVEGSCDLLLAYHHPSQPLQLNPERYEMLSLGHETLVAYAKGDAAGRPMFSLPAATGHPVPFLSYADRKSVV